MSDPRSRHPGEPPRELRPPDGPPADEPLEPIAFTGRPLLTGPPEPAQRDPAPAERLQRRLITGAFALALLAAVGVFYLLPRAVEDRTREGQVAETAAAEANAGGRTAGEGEAEATVPRPVRDSASPSRRSAAELDLLLEIRAEAERALAQLEEKQEALEAKAVEKWAPADYEAALARVAQGDRLVQERDYRGAVREYSDVLAVFDALLERAAEVLERSLAAGALALEAGDARESAERFLAALAIDPENETAKRGLARAESLDEVVGLVQSGLAHEERERLDEARTDFARAAELDPEYAPATAALERVTAAIARANFRRAMSQGLLALDEGHFERARSAFREAAGWRPDAREPVDGLAQAESGIRLLAISGHRARAEAFEAEERWTEAGEQYAAMLALDPALRLAKDGSARARVYADVNERLEYHLAHPERLGSEEVLEEAEVLLGRAAALDVLGPRLLDNIKALAKLVAAARTEVAIRVESDALTDVVVFRVGRLGRFQSKELTLRPGTYTVVGTRDGYRDFRTEFAVRAEDPNPTWVVRCEEKL